MKCQLCGKEITNAIIHRWQEHRELMIAAREKATDKRRKQPRGDVSKPSSVSGKSASTLDDAVSVTITPKTFTMSSILLWQAREAAIREWNWPADITPEDFLDTYLFESFKQRGIILGGYQVIDRKKCDSGS